MIQKEKNCPILYNEVQYNDCEYDLTLSVVVNIEYKLSEVSIYEDSIIKTSIIVFNDDYCYDRRLNEKRKLF